jgi:hypothetical protein
MSALAVSDLADSELTALRSKRLPPGADLPSRPPARGCPPGWHPGFRTRGRVVTLRCRHAIHRHRRNPGRRTDPMRVARPRSRQPWLGQARDVVPRLAAAIPPASPSSTATACRVRGIARPVRHMARIVAACERAEIRHTAREEAARLGEKRAARFHSQSKDNGRWLII